MKLFRKSLGVGAGALALLFSMGAHADATYDLTTNGATANIGGATYTQVPAQPTGSGVIKSFVRTANNGGLEQGYNTTANNVYDNFGGNTFNHQITVGQVGFITVGGVQVMRFLLDINQTGDNPLLSLDEVQIFLSKTANMSDEPSLAQGQLLNPLMSSQSELVYQMDAGANNRVNLNFALNSGSGSGDMFLDIPITAFGTAFTNLGMAGDTTAQNGAFVYLYARYGDGTNVTGNPTAPTGYPNNDGYEEWTYIKGAPINGECVPTPQNPCGGPPQEIPEPGTLALLGAGLLGLAYKRRKQT